MRLSSRVGLVLAGVCGGFLLLGPGAGVGTADGLLPCAEHSHARAGNPLCQHPWAKPSNTPHYGGYYVGGGGGKLRRGDPPCLDEGTWGWDYFGVQALRHRIALWWNHGRRYQGGIGAYETDGPEVPDVIAALKLPSFHKKEKD